MVDCAEAGDYAGGEQEVWFRLDSQGVHLLVVWPQSPQEQLVFGISFVRPS